MKDSIDLSPEENTKYNDILQENPFETPDHFQRFLLQQQLKIAKSKTTGPKKWHPAIIHWCLHIKSKSASTYDALRQVLSLPSQRTLYNHSLDLRTKSGFQEDTLKEMRREINFEKLEEHEKYVSLMLDEMSVKQDLIYRTHTGEIVGYTNSNESCNKIKELSQQFKQGEDAQPNLATHVLQFMVRGLVVNFKYPYSYFPCDKMGSEELYSLLWEAVENLHNGGFKVLTVVCDKAAVNQKLIKLCCSSLNNDSGVAYKTKNLFSRGDYIYFISDPPHLIKTIRNNLESSGNAKNTRLLKKNKKHLLWSHVTETFEKDSELDSGLRLSRLTYDHVHLNSFSRMKVNLAAQVLSDRTSKAMSMLVGADASETIKFLELVNNFFDTMNVRRLEDGKHKRNCFLDPYRSVNDWRFKWLRETFLGYFNDWEAEVDALQVDKHFDKSKMLLSRETREGIKVTVNSIIEAVQFLLNKGARFVFTERFCQDPLERYFGQHRSATGCNDNPTILGYQQSIPKIKCMGKYLMKVKNGNITAKSKKIKTMRRLLVENEKQL